MGKIYREDSVLVAAQKRISYSFDNFEKIFVSFSGGKDSSVMLHLVCDEAKKRNKKVGVLIVDLEAQYKETIKHLEDMMDHYKEYIDPYWVCLPLSLRNAASNFDPRWICWDEEKKDSWVRSMPKNCISDLSYFPFFQKGMEFEEFIVLFAQWYGQGKLTSTMVGIRADESLNRYRTVASRSYLRKKEMFNNNPWTTLVVDNCYNCYPIYDWKTSDIWVYKRKYSEKPYNLIYDLMHKAGVSPSQQRLCQPYGDDQRRGLWLYHLLEPETWFKVVARVSGVNSMALYVEESGNITGYNKIFKPKGHTYKSFCNLLLTTMPKKSRDHYLKRFKSFIKGWRSRGYDKEIPDEAPYILESKHWAPSYRRLCKVLLRNDYWCKGLGLTQPKSEAYGKYLEIKKERQSGKNNDILEE
jgi:predicted phosphoadenosine phosphosulfate sulfurtransferase